MTSHSAEGQIRVATAADVPAIVALMQSELGWPEDPRAEALWRWKHEQNPFGTSLVWVAECGGEVIALRAFMRWRMITSDGQVLQAARAVDTATRHDQRGRGWFRALTLHGLGALQDHGIAFVFNTPNEQSRPGYLSMGWRDVGRLPVWVRPTRWSSLLSMVRSRTAAELWPAHHQTQLAAMSELLASDADPAALSLVRRADRWRPAAGSVGTERSFEYLAWRYGLPALGYRWSESSGRSGEGVVIVRDRARGESVERVMLDEVGDFGSWRSVIGGDSAVDYLLALGPRPGWGWLPVPGAGPRLVARPIGDNVVPSAFDLTLGDVELL